MNSDLFSIPAQAFGWLGPWVLVAQIVVYWIKLRPRMKELKDNADGSLRTQLMARIATLEQRIDEKDEQCNRRIEVLERLWIGPGAASTLRQVESGGG